MPEDTRSPEQIVADLVEKSPICMVTTATADGRLEARPMTRQDSAFDGRIRFLAPRGGDRRRSHARFGHERHSGAVI